MKAGITHTHTHTHTRLRNLQIEGKLSGKMHPFVPYARDINGATFSNTYMYARDPTEQEIKTFMQPWRLYIYNTKIKPKQIYHSKENYELPF